MYFNRKLLLTLMFINALFTPNVMHPNFICILKTSEIELSNSRCTILLHSVNSTRMLIAIQYPDLKTDFLMNPFRSVYVFVALYAHMLSYKV